MDQHVAVFSFFFTWSIPSFQEKKDEEQEGDDTSGLEEGEFEVERILDVKLKDGIIKFEVRFLSVFFFFLPYKLQLLAHVSSTPAENL